MTREDLKKLVDINKDGTVDVKDVLKLVKNNAKDALYLGVAAGVFAGALMAFVLCMVF